MSKYLIIRTGRVRTKMFGRVGDVYTIIEERTGKYLQVYKNIYNSFGEYASKPEYARYIEPFYISNIGIRDARKMPEILSGMITEPGKDPCEIEHYFLTRG